MVAVEDGPPLTTRKKSLTVLHCGSLKTMVKCFLLLLKSFHLQANHQTAIFLGLNMTNLNTKELDKWISTLSLELKGKLQITSTTYNNDRLATPPGRKKIYPKMQINDYICRWWNKTRADFDEFCCHALRVKFFNQLYIVYLNLPLGPH